MKKVLFLTSADLMKSYHSGGEHACKKNLELLQDIYGKENVDIFFFSEWKGDFPEHYYAVKRLRKWKALLAQIMGNITYFPWSEKKILKIISNLKPDIIFFDGSLTGNLLRKIPTNIYTVVFEHNFEKKYHYLKMKHEGWMYAPGYWAASKCEKIAIVIVSQFAKQTEIFNDLLKRQGLFIAPNNEIFYSQEEFLNSSYEKSLSKKQRLELFSEFKRLEV